jgi:flagellar assembly protein FliH
VPDFRPLVRPPATKDDDGFQPLSLPRLKATAGAAYAKVLREDAEFLALTDWDGESGGADRVRLGQSEPPVVDAEFAEPAPAAGPPPAPHIDPQALERAFQEGLAEGRRQAMAEHGARWKAQSRVFEQAIASVQQIRDAVFTRSIQDVAEAVVLISWHVIRRELAVPGHQVESLVRSVIGEVRASDEIMVRVAPQDKAEMRAALPTLLEELGRDTSVRLEADPGISSGGAIVETSWGRVDATVETQLQAFAETVEGWATAAIENHGTEA